MITGSILLALVAVVCLSVGLIRGQEEFYYCSIVASLLAGLALFAGLRQRPAAQLPVDDFDVVPRDDRRRARPTGRARVRGATRPGPAGTTYRAGTTYGAGGTGTGVAPAPRTEAGLPDDPAGPAPKG